MTARRPTGDWLAEALDHLFLKMYPNREVRRTLSPQEAFREGGITAYINATRVNKSKVRRSYLVGLKRGYRLAQMENEQR